MKKVSAVIVLGSSLFLTACVPGNHMYSASGACLTCVNNPATGEPLNYDPDETPMFKAATVSQVRTSGSNVGAGQYFNGEFTMNSSRDVDSVYAMMRSSFGFRTEQQMSKTVSGRFGMESDAWRHEVVPGAFYNLSDYARLSVNGVSTSFVMSVKVVKNRSGSIVTVGYSDTKGNETEFANTLRGRVKSLL